MQRIPNSLDIIAFARLEDGIRLENVTFRYSPHEAPVLKNVTLAIPRGKVTAIVGASGSGKSTIVNLVARLYECNEGRIYIDKSDLCDLDVASWRDQLAVVSQDTLLYNDTLMANLRFARGHQRARFRNRTRNSACTRYVWKRSHIARRCSPIVDNSQRRQNRCP